ncbi:hypothetical protein CN378_08965 [Bacillus sp. AFS015802]|nr:anti-repressor SinI family protein [Bacillus sp. AFS015802]PFA68220.1 hypothetical protein CN378_08965 [Bacillus sp. AFS015802]
MANRELDMEWVELVRQALEAGIPKADIRDFLHGQSPQIKEEYKVI